MSPSLSLFLYCWMFELSTHPVYMSQCLIYCPVFLPASPFDSRGVVGLGEWVGWVYAGWLEDSKANLQFSLVYVVYSILNARHPALSSGMALRRYCLLALLLAINNIGYFFPTYSVCLLGLSRFDPLPFVANGHTRGVMSR